MKVKNRILWTQWGEHAREILHQYNEARCDSYRFHGPHYVTYERGVFMLRPYGPWKRHRYSFECRPDFIPGHPEPLWTFVVL
jgi:hypothetical protein